MSQGPNEIPAGAQCRAASLLHPQNLAASLPINPPISPHTSLQMCSRLGGGDHFKLSFHGLHTGITAGPV